MDGVTIPQQYLEDENLQGIGNSMFWALGMTLIALISSESSNEI
jgi:hypothetical protein